MKKKLLLLFCMLWFQEVLSARELEILISDNGTVTSIGEINTHKKSSKKSYSFLWKLEKNVLKSYKLIWKVNNGKRLSTSSISIIEKRVMLYIIEKYLSSPTIKSEQIFESIKDGSWRKNHKNPLDTGSAGDRPFEKE